MKRGKKKAMIIREALGKMTDKVPLHERRAELFARRRGKHTPFYVVKVLRRGHAAVAKMAA